MLTLGFNLCFSKNNYIEWLAYTLLIYEYRMLHLEVMESLRLLAPGVIKSYHTIVTQAIYWAIWNKNTQL